MEKYVNWKLIKNDLFDRFFIWYELDIDENVLNQLLEDKIIHLFSKNPLYLKYIRSNYGISSEDIDKYIEKYKSDKLKKMILLKPYLFFKYPGYLKAAKLLCGSSTAYEVGNKFTSKMITYKKGNFIFPLALPSSAYFTDATRIILYIWKNT